MSCATEAERDKRDRDVATRSPGRRRGCASFFANLEQFGGGKAIDRALDLEQGVDALHRFECDRRDRGCVFAAQGICGNVGELEKLAPGVRPAKRRCVYRKPHPVERKSESRKLIG